MLSIVIISAMQIYSRQRRHAGDRSASGGDTPRAQNVMRIYEYSVTASPDVISGRGSLLVPLGLFRRELLAMTFVDWYAYFRQRRTGVDWYRVFRT